MKIKSMMDTSHSKRKKVRKNKANLLKLMMKKKIKRMQSALSRLRTKINITKVSLSSKFLEIAAL